MTPCATYAASRVRMHAGALLALLVFATSGCAQNVPDEASLSEKILMYTIAMEPFSHGRIVVLSERSLGRLPPNLNAALRKHLPQYYPTLRITPAVDPPEVEPDHPGEGERGLKREPGGVSYLEIGVSGGGGRRELALTLTCGPTCGVGNRIVLEWLGSRWIETDSTSLMF